MTVIKYQGKTEKEKTKACCKTLCKEDFHLRVSEISRSREIRSLVQAGVELAFHAPSLSKVIRQTHRCIQISSTGQTHARERKKIGFT